jgi:biotin carboxyl carrier protein
MDAPKPISILVVPFQFSNLCFENDGIIEDINIEIGSSVPAFDFKGLYQELRLFPKVPTSLVGGSGSSGKLKATVNDDPSRLKFDDKKLLERVHPYSLARMRAEGAKVTLRDAVNARQSAYNADPKYSDPEGFRDIADKYVDRTSPDSKYFRLSRLIHLSDQLKTNLQKEYKADEKDYIIKNTSSRETGTANQSAVVHRDDDNPIVVPPVPEEGAPWEYSVRKGDKSAAKSVQQGSNQREITNYDYGYRWPSLEAEAQWHRSQISLMDEQYMEFYNSHKQWHYVNRLSSATRNDLQAMDNSVYQYQILLLKSVLMSPLPGLVTGIYKSPGDWVVAGEPVIRVETTDKVLLFAKLVYRGRISVGTKLTFTSNLFDNLDPMATVEGTVVAVRGERENNQWAVTVKCDNLDTAGKPILPLGYQFDRDNTTISLT